jgi:hypothetical protein
VDERALGFRIGLQRPPPRQGRLELLPRIQSRTPAYDDDPDFAKACQPGHIFWGAAPSEPMIFFSLRSAEFRMANRQQSHRAD